MEFFKVQTHFLRQTFIWSSWKGFSYLNINLGEKLSIRIFVIQSILRKVYLVKMCPNFAGSDSKNLTSNQKILSICSFEYGIYWISPDTPRNSTTVITLLGINRSAIRNERRTIWWLTFNRHKPDNSWHSSRNEYISWSGISRYTQLDLTGYFKMHSI